MAFFSRIVARYHGDGGVRNLTCAQELRALAFDQLTRSKSPRDLVTCLDAVPAKRYRAALPCWSVCRPLPAPTRGAPGTSARSSS